MNSYVILDAALKTNLTILLAGRADNLTRNRNSRKLLPTSCSGM